MQREFGSEGSALSAEHGNEAARARQEDIGGGAQNKKSKKIRPIELRRRILGQGLRVWALGMCAVQPSPDGSKDWLSAWAYFHFLPPPLIETGTDVWETTIHRSAQTAACRPRLTRRTQATFLLPSLSCTASVLGTHFLSACISTHVVRFEPPFCRSLAVPASVASSLARPRATSLVYLRSAALLLWQTDSTMAIAYLQPDPLP